MAVAQPQAADPDPLEPEVRVLGAEFLRALESRTGEAARGHREESWVDVRHIANVLNGAAGREGTLGAVLHLPVRVCFVCSGNICRSPTAEVVLNRLLAEAGMSDVVTVDSAGTGSWHSGDDMDERSRATMQEAGYDVPVHAAKQFQSPDFGTRDLVVTLDSGHQNVLWWLAVDTPDLEAARAKTVPLRAFDPLLAPGEDPDVPDPYYGAGGGFTEVLEQVERSCAQLLGAIRRAVEAGADVVEIVAQQVDRPPL
jgi:protein-tyrosine phosphatase